VLRGQEEPAEGVEEVDVQAEEEEVVVVVEGEEVVEGEVDARRSSYKCFVYPCVSRSERLMSDIDFEFGPWMEILSIGTWIVRDDNHSASQSSIRVA
jgi:hypothetical protein